MHVYIGIKSGEARGHAPRFYNFLLGIRFLLYKSTLWVSGPSGLSAFLHSYMYMLNTNTVHMMPTSSQYSYHCLEVVWVFKEHFSGVYCHIASMN